MSEGWRGMCGVPTDMTAGEGLLTAIRRAVAMADVECQVPATEPCFLRYREHTILTTIAFELLAMLERFPGGAEQLAAMRTRWQADPETCAANLRALVAQPRSTSPDADDRPCLGSICSVTQGSSAGGRPGDSMDYTIGVMTQGESPDDIIGIAVDPGAAALIHLGVELVLEAYDRDPQATLARLAEVAARGDEPFRVPPELLVSDEG